jgi:hypothetical protein
MPSLGEAKPKPKFSCSFVKCPAIYGIIGFMMSSGIFIEDCLLLAGLRPRRAVSYFIQNCREFLDEHQEGDMVLKFCTSKQSWREGVGRLPPPA